MKLDIVVPDNNELELLEMADKLGFKEIIFLYDNINKKIPKISSKKIKIYTSILINNAKDIDKAKKNFDYVFGPAQRNFFENKRVMYLINAEASPGKDLLYQRRAGLDDVMIRLAKEKGKVIVFNLQLLSQNNNIQNTNINNIQNTNINTNIFSRMMQNARLCRKHKVKTIIATLATKPLEMRAPKDLQGFARSIKLL